MNALTIDFESWVHRDFLYPNDYYKRKLSDDGYCIHAARKILDMLSSHNTKATFFIVGEILDWYPEIGDMIVKGEHELAYHTYSHKLLKNVDILRNELHKDIIDKFDMKGFRAPEAYILREHLKILKEYGFVYDSSIYGSSEITNIDGLYEIPVTTIQLFKRSSVYFPKHLTLSLLMKEIPICSGFFFALLGSNLSMFIRRLNRYNKSAVLLVHPWQIVKPEVNISNHEGLKKIAMKLYTKDRSREFTKLLEIFSFTTLYKLIEEKSLINE